VWLRRALASHPELREAVLGVSESRIPMVFQYNPLETYFETTAEDELVVTLNSTAIMSPRLRYNIGDEAKLLDFPAVQAIVDRFPRLALGFDRAFQAQRMRLPFVLLFGRKDSTVSYMGANIYPLDVENGLYLRNPLAHEIASFKLALADVAALEQRPAIHLQLREGSSLDAGQRARLAEAARAGVLEHLARVSRDFAQSLEEDAATGDMRVLVHDAGTGPFAGDGGRIKNVYLVDAGDRERDGDAHA
jgi:phenylacetate-CoA ligase